MNKKYYIFLLLLFPTFAGALPVFHSLDYFLDPSCFFTIRNSDNSSFKGKKTLLEYSFEFENTWRDPENKKYSARDLNNVLFSRFSLPLHAGLLRLESFGIGFAWRNEYADILLPVIKKPVSLKKDSVSFYLSGQMGYGRFIGLDIIAGMENLKKFQSQCFLFYQYAEKGKMSLSLSLDYNNLPLNTPGVEPGTRYVLSSYYVMIDRSIMLEQSVGPVFLVFGCGFSDINRTNYLLKGSNGKVFSRFQRFNMVGSYQFLSWLSCSISWDVLKGNGFPDTYYSQLFWFLEGKKTAALFFTCATKGCGASLLFFNRLRMSYQYHLLESEGVLTLYPASSYFNIVNMKIDFNSLFDVHGFDLEYDMRLPRNCRLYFQPSFLEILLNRAASEKYLLLLFYSDDKDTDVLKDFEVSLLRLKIRSEIPIKNVSIILRLSQIIPLKMILNHEVVGNRSVKQNFVQPASQDKRKSRISYYGGTECGLDVRTVF